MDIFAALMALYGMGNLSLCTATVVTESGSTYRIEMAAWSTKWSRQGGAYNGLASSMREDCEAAYIDADTKRLVIKGGGGVVTTPVVSVSIK